MIEQLTIQTHKDISEAFLKMFFEYAHENHSYTLTDLNILLKRITEGHLIDCALYLESGNLFGFIMYAVIPSAFGDNNNMLIHDLYVTKKRQGIGTKLMNHVIEVSKDLSKRNIIIDEIVWMTGQDNIVAQQLYCNFNPYEEKSINYSLKLSEFVRIEK